MTAPASGDPDRPGAADAAGSAAEAGAGGVGSAAEAGAGGPGSAAEAGAGGPGSAAEAGAGGAGSGAEAGSGTEGERRSGLRNPAAAVRGLGAGALVLEAIVLLLAIQPIRVLGGELSGWGIAAVVAMAMLCILIAGSMKRRWAWHAGTAVQVLLLASGLVHWSLALLGLIFGAAWGYASYVRKTILG
jgi:hypothetical protein